MVFRGHKDCVHKGGGGFRWPRMCFRTMASHSALGASLGARASIHSGLVTNAREHLFRFLQIANDFDTSQCSEFGSPVDFFFYIARSSANFNAFPLHISVPG